MLTDLHVIPSQEPSIYVALRGEQSRVPVHIRVARTAIDDLPQSGGHPTADQRTAFVRHNIDAIRAMLDKRLARGDAQSEQWYGRTVLGVRIVDADIAEYLGEPSHRLSYAAFSAGCIWTDRSGRFG
jgi:hypothetical protein